jgi:hypothetical protein
MQCVLSVSLRESARHYGRAVVAQQKNRHDCQFCRVR